MTLTLAAIVILLGVPFFLMTPSELAPKEDQGVILGIVQASPNSTIEQTTLYTKKVNDVFLSTPGNTAHLPTHPAFHGLRRHGPETVERAHAI